MQIASTMRAPTSQSADEYILRADGTTSMPIGSAGPPFSPGSNAWVKYGKTLLDMPGAIYVRMMSSRPNDVIVQFEAPEFAALAKNVLRDTIDGANMVLTAPDRPLPATPGAPYAWNWWDNPSNMARAVAGLRGVVFADRLGSGGTQVWTDNQAQIDLLRPLVRESFAGGRVVWLLQPHVPAKPTP